MRESSLKICVGSSLFKAQRMWHLATTLACALTSAGAKLVHEAAVELAPAFASVDVNTKSRLRKTLAAFKRVNLNAQHFAGVDGYGYGDLGREALDEVYAELFGAEAAIVRVQCFSGTHAIACALFGTLRPGDELLAVSGRPYDTLEEVIGLRGRTEDGLRGTLADFGVTYSQVELAASGSFDLEAIDNAMRKGVTKMVHVQRSCGYAWRPSIRIDEVCRLAAWLRDHHPEVLLFVDNCYGEFVEEREPSHVGAHLVAGSLIKNPGGTLAPTGGYVAGRADLVAAAGRRLAAPGVEGGATLGQTRALFQGLFLAPQIVGEALKGAMLVAHVFERLGYACNPPALAARTDIIQAIELGERDKVLAFCRAVQRCSPVGSGILPVAGITPGYGDEVVFADGTFIEGSTLELSADGPLREPFAVYLQGGTHWTHWQLILEEIVDDFLLKGPEAKAFEVAERYAGRRGLRNT